MTVFEDQDAEFLSWQRRHPEGFVLNIYHGPPSNGVIHPAGFSHFQARQDMHPPLYECSIKTYGENKEPTSGLEPLTPAPATSVRSVVSGHCTELQNPHRNRVFCPLCCPLLQGSACG